MEEIKKLKIYCLSDIANRLDNTKRILLHLEKDDIREPMRSMAVDILRASCVPEQYQIIDDREIGTSD